MSGARHNRSAERARQARRDAAIARPEIGYGTHSREPVRLVAPRSATAAPIKELDPALRALIDAARQRPPS